MIQNLATQDQLQAINTSLSNLEATTISGITWASGILYNYSRIYKMGKLLFVNFHVTYSTAPTYNSIVLTLPNTVKLAQSQYAMCFGVDDSGKRYNVQINSNPSSNTLSFSSNGAYGDACKTIDGMAMYTLQ